MQRKRSHLSIPRGLDFVPLEIFLDVRSEATDYDRIILKTDITLAFDRFNHLRMPRGLEWPDAKDEDGEIIRHLRVHQVGVSLLMSADLAGSDHRHRSTPHHVSYIQALHSSLRRRHRPPYVSRSRPSAPLGPYRQLRFRLRSQGSRSSAAHHGSLQLAAEYPQPYSSATRL